MLQIISGKFFSNDGEIRHNDCHGVLYSNLEYYGNVKYKNIELHTVDWKRGMPTYVLRFDNNIEVVDSTKILVKVGDDEIIRQMKYILTFSLNGIFDENESAVEKIIRTDISQGDTSEHFLGDIVRNNKFISDDELQFSISFYNQMIGLRREDYKIIMQCLSAYYSVIRVLYEDISLSYSILVYCIESLSSNYDKYIPTWDDYDCDIKEKLERVLSGYDNELFEKVKTVLIKDKHLKLSKRFVNFVLSNVTNNFFEATDRKGITYDELENALQNAYSIRSKYAHELKPIMKQLQIGSFSDKCDTFEWEHAIFLTYGGLIRLVRHIIINFVGKCEKVEKEDYPWYLELPGIVNIKLSPTIWLGKAKDNDGSMGIANLEGLLQCIQSDPQNVPNMNECVERYLTHFSEIKKNNKAVVLALCWIYILSISNLDKEYKEKIVSKLKLHLEMISECNIYNILIFAITQFDYLEIDWTVDDMIKEISKYNKYKFKKNHIKLPDKVENHIYIMIAENVQTNEQILYWYNKAYKNCVNNKELQETIGLKLKELGSDS
ncbi:MAG: hypothetical protein OSJ70_10570 [Bacilli bacterium]|nr:hypothetical protein [Bacilli bacterium]